MAEIKGHLDQMSNDDIDKLSKDLIGEMNQIALGNFRISRIAV